MKINKKYLVLSMALVLAVAGLGFGSLLNVAHADTPLSCSAGSAMVGLNQNNTMTAVGGNGVYSWTGQNLNVTNSSGTQFVVSYPNPGVYTITVSSGGQTASCNTNVLTTVPSNGFACLATRPSVALGQSATFAAIGGNGAYSWSSTDLTITNPTGSGFSASYASAGVKTMTVTSNGLLTSCTVNILPGASEPATPGMPNTGGGFGQ